MGSCRKLASKMGCCDQAQIAVVRRPAVQRRRNAAQAKIAAQIRWSTAAREYRLLRAGKLLRARTMYWVRLLWQRGAVLSSNLLILFPDHIYLVRLPKSLQEFSLGTWLGFAHFATVGSTYLPD